ncbi:TniQ family protein [Shewanella glacialipiscicola]|uniref:TniQ family protein n=1 Tax=Shewanella glacialipiscicola TaxID=614069 RepID=UPI0021D8E801|nr:TniQ family protein [Shewanella glacialipiscicola]MCU7995268.1 TniQ family protein [Shewanella glacialipiscicola]MCU8026611.1 TniQ family protein [Shewanella glacialipiscicola]
MDKPWPIDMPLMQDEILSSWIIRTAFENGSYPLAWSWYLWGKRRVWTIDIDRFCQPDYLALLVTPSITHASLNSATLFPWLSNVVSLDLQAYNHSWPWVNPLGSRNRDRTGGLRYCPICLSNSPAYYRRLWRFSWQHSCAVHQCLLRDCCPNCAGPICPHKFKSGTSNIALCALCGHSLCDITVEKSSQLSLKTQVLMNIVLEGSRTYELPWEMKNASELFLTIRYLVALLNRAYLDQLVADRVLFKFLEIEQVPFSALHSSVERTSIERMHLWFDKIYIMLSTPLVSFAEQLAAFGYTQRTLLGRVSLPCSPQIQFLLKHLPDGLVRTRTVFGSRPNKKQPTPRAIVESMWCELKDFLP